MASDGEARFATKGLVYLGAKEYFETVVSGGSDAVLDRLPNDELRGFYSQIFVAVGWYDILPIVPITQAAALACGHPSDRLITETARYMANRDIRGVLRFLLRLASPEMVAKRLPKASMQYFNFGTATGRLVSPKRFEADQTDIPIEIAGWMMRAVEGFSHVALELAGATHPTIRGQPVADESPEDARTYTIRYKIAWQ